MDNSNNPLHHEDEVNDDEGIDEKNASAADPLENMEDATPSSATPSSEEGKKPRPSFDYPELATSAERSNFTIELLSKHLWNKDNTMDDILEILFHINKRGSSWRLELYCGFVQFVSCSYILPVLPEQMHPAGYDINSVITITSIACGIGCLVSGFFTNLPLIIAPPTAVSVFLSIYLRQQNIGRTEGSVAVIISGALLLLLGSRTIGKVVKKFIPNCIQAGTAVGIGLFTAFVGTIDINLVTPGKYTLVDMGEITGEIVIAMAGLIIGSVALHYHVKGAFCIALLFGTFVWWIYKNAWPDSIAAAPTFDTVKHLDGHHGDVAILTADLTFLYILTLSGLASSLADLASLVRPDGTTPRSRWIFIMCGLTTIFSGLLCGPPVLLSPESAAGIKAGAKTGLSTIVCGLFFCLSTFFSPIFKAVPFAGTSPLLMLVGVLLFQNVKKVDWTDIKEAVPAFVVLFFIPFTYSIIQGVAIGYIMYIAINLFTGDLYTQGKEMYDSYMNKTPDTKARTSFA